jgi:hypothetical protein
MVTRVRPVVGAGTEYSYHDYPPHVCPRPVSGIGEMGKRSEALKP